MWLCMYTHALKMRCDAIHQKIFTRMYACVHARCAPALCMYVGVLAYTYIYVYICICTCVYVCMYVHDQRKIYCGIYTYVYVCVCIYIYMHMYMYMYVCTHALRISVKFAGFFLFVNGLKLSSSGVNYRFWEKFAENTANLKITDVRYHDFNGFPVANWY